MTKRLPNISIERYAAYLDGNLPDEEMQQMDAFIENDTDMQAILEADDSIEAVPDMDLSGNEPVPYGIELSSIELPSLDFGSPFESDSFVDDFFPMDGDRFGEETGSIMNDVVNHHEFMDETDYIDDNLEIEDSSLGLAGSEDESGLAHDTPYDWGIHDGDYGFLELGLPPIINGNDLIGTENISADSYETNSADDWIDSFDN